VTDHHRVRKTYKMAVKNKEETNIPNEPPWKVSLQLVTPEMAGQFLRNNYVNRPINPKTTEKYEGDMVADLWLEPTPIYFTLDGKLLDGQHRMSALIAANKSFWFVVVENVDPEIIDAIDGGAKRSDTQRLVMHGQPKEISGLLASMLGFVLNYKEHRIFSGGISFPKKWDFHGMHDQMAEYADYWANAELDGVTIKKTVLASFNFITSLQDKDKSTEFFNQLLEPNGLEEGSPVLALKEYCEKTIPAKGQTQGEVRKSAIALLLAWQAFYEGKTVKKIAPGAEIPRLPIKW